VSLECPPCIRIIKDQAVMELAVETLKVLSLPSIILTGFVFYVL
jgi:hypothetical protein